MKALFTTLIITLFMSPNPGKRGLLRLADANAILGESSSLTDSSSVNESEVKKYRCNYTALNLATQKERTGKIHYLLEEYGNAEAATHTYKTMFQGNLPNGNLTSTGIGDEAFIQTDKTNFYLLVIRKGNHLVRIKVNKLTAKTDRVQVAAVGANIAADL